jgi:transcription antitermination protein NusB
MASRHLSRIAALQALFAADIRADVSLATLIQTWEANTDSLAHDDEDHTFTKQLLHGISAKHHEIDAVIEKAAPQWPIEKIAAMDRTILRLGLYELLYGSTISVPPKVALNEAIELAKIFGGDASPKFINGVMGAVYREMGSPRKGESPRHESPRDDHAAGVVVCAHDAGVWYVALILDPFHKWTTPRSSVHPGELAHTAAVRAVAEELGIRDLTSMKPIGEYHYPVRKPGEETGDRHVMYFLACTKKVPLTPSVKESVKDARWFLVTDLPEEAMYDDLRILIESGITIAQTEYHHE